MLHYFYSSFIFMVDSIFNRIDTLFDMLVTWSNTFSIEQSVITSFVGILEFLTYDPIFPVYLQAAFAFRSVSYLIIVVYRTVITIKELIFRWT